MNCHNCGAPMTLVPQRDHYLCGYCGSVSYPEAEKDGLVLTKEPSGEECPNCHVPLMKGSIEDLPLSACARCRGLLVAQEEFRRMVALLRPRLTPRPYAHAPADPAEMKRRVHCPQCGAQMETHPYYAAPGNIVVATCSTCVVLWLDKGKLQRIASLTEGPTP